MAKTSPGEFIRQVRAETAKVSWPTGRETGMTVVMVSHELPSLLAICDDGIFLDAESGTAIAHGAPRVLLESCDHPTVHAFMTRQRPPSDQGQNAGGDHGGR